MNIKERLELKPVVESFTGGFEEVKKIMTLAKELEISETEKQEIGLRQEESAITWSSEKDPNKVIDLTPYKEVLLKALDQTKANIEKKQGFTVSVVEMLERIQQLLA